ncbi:MAG: glycosyltransferase family 2 protein [Marinilabiliaceae bacterium]|nr:glycosyltransferase family 2 protein [Marinilabiliaceae bacterium]
MRLSIVIPCLNEESAIRSVIHDAHDMARLADVDANDYEVVVADNGSRDRSVEYATQEGARCIMIEDIGYGNALRGGLDAARGDVIIMADADGSYDLKEATAMFRQIENGECDMVIGNRLHNIHKGAMPWSHRYFGVPLLSLMGRLKYRTDIRDFHCGMRAISRQNWQELSKLCKASGMEFASEMIGKAVMTGCQIAQIPVTLRNDLRSEGEESHLKTIRDGFRHLREIFFN